MRKSYIITFRIFHRSIMVGWFGRSNERRFRIWVGSKSY